MNAPAGSNRSLRTPASYRLFSPGWSVKLFRVLVWVLSTSVVMINSSVLIDHNSRQSVTHHILGRRTLS
jgi:hypothetical protein